MSSELASKYSCKIPPVRVEQGEKKCLTPIERYLAKTGEMINETDKKLQDVTTKERYIKERIQAPKETNAGHCSLCRHCHMRLGHNARNCTFDQCTSVCQWGKDKFHSGEINLKALTEDLKKLRHEKEKLTEELKCKNSATEKGRDRLENSLIDVGPASYHVRGVKN